MRKLIISTAIYLAANAIGLLLAIVLLTGFQINIVSFLLAVLIFSGAQALVGPLLDKTLVQRFPQLTGGVSLVTIFAGLWITDVVMAGMRIGGLSNWLAATLLVWLGSLVASIVLPIYFARQDTREPDS